MAVDPLQDWKDTLANLPKVADASWALNFANWYAGRIASISPDPNILTASGFLFTFVSATFATNLATLMPTSDPISGTMGFANAWQTAIALTIYPATLTLMPGTVYGTPATQANTFSVITSVTLNPASITAAYTKLLELATAPAAEDPQDSAFPEIFRDATLLLKVDITGSNGVPSPLAAVGVPLV